MVFVDLLLKETLGERKKTKKEGKKTKKESRLVPCKCLGPGSTRAARLLGSPLHAPDTTPWPASQTERHFISRFTAALIYRSQTLTNDHTQAES